MNGHQQYSAAPKNEEYVDYMYQKPDEFWYGQNGNDGLGMPNDTQQDPMQFDTLNVPQSMDFLDTMPNEQFQPTPRPPSTVYGGGVQQFGGVHAPQQTVHGLTRSQTPGQNFHNRMPLSVGVSPALVPALSPALAPVPLDPLENPFNLQESESDPIEHRVPNPLEEDTNQNLRAILARRQKYKAASSIPPDLSRAHYAAQCIAAATSSRLPPFKLHPNEYNVLRQVLSLRHVTTYLNVRNGILRLWLLNPTVAVTMVEAAGCVRDSRFFTLAEFAFEWLLRNGYINHGCLEPGLEVPPSLSFHLQPPPTMRRKPRQTIVIVGSGIAGLCAARQLESLCKVYKAAFSEYADIPKIMLLESRRRSGGRVHSATIGDGAIVELGASTVPGFGGGNPLAPVLRRQLGLPCVQVAATDDLYNADNGQRVDQGINYRAHELFSHLLDRMSAFDDGPAPATAEGDKVLIQAARDPPVATTDADELRTIASAEERSQPYGDSGQRKRSSAEAQTAVEMKFLQELGYEITDAHSQVHITAKPSGGNPSLGLTMNALVDQLRGIAKLTDEDMKALNWYYAKFEYSMGDCLDKVSLSSWSHYRTHRFTGHHSWVKNGFANLARALASIPSRLDIRYQTEVKIVEYDDDQVQLQLGNGDQVKADKVIMTVPLGVLKKRSLQFIPDLPQWKTDSIERLGFGTVNKVVLSFNKCFWDENKYTFRVMQEGSEGERGVCFMFQNLMPATGKPVLTALFSGEAANRVGEGTDAEIVDWCLSPLKKIFHCDDSTVKLEESIVTRWQLDPYSYGAYSYVGTEGTIVDHDLLGRPVQQSLFFAGEGTSRFYPGTVHGAYLSGLRVAKEVLNSLIGSLEVPDELVPFMNGTSSSSYPEPSPMPQAQSHRSTPQVSTPQTYPPYQQQSFSQSQNFSYKPRAHTSVSLEELEGELEALRSERVKNENDHMEQDLLNELGHRPEKPERSGNTNPFLLFQKDYWEICRKQTDEQRRGHASRNEIRAMLGRRWKALSQEDKQPYIDRTQRTKEDNELQYEDYVRRVKWYDSEADNFRRQWKIDHPEKISDRERELSALIQELNPKRKRSRLTD